jgi:sigma-E factor negative regulatory protein RseA
MKERISALMDGELGDPDLNQDLVRLKSDPDLRRTWDTYHLIGDVLRDHLVRGYAARVSARLAAEPTVLAPPRRAARGKLPQIAFSAAAGVAGVALVAWLALPALSPEPPQVALSAPMAPPAAAVTPAAVGVDNYLLAHQNYSPAGAMQGVAPYVRTVSDRQGERKR